VQPDDLFIAPEPNDELFLLAHTREYYEGFVNKTLSPEAMRRIGKCSSPILELSVLVTNEVRQCAMSMNEYNSRMAFPVRTI
jgi:hypothetical protein